MIPKVMIYIWLGGKKYPGVVKECLDSWTQHLPYYKIIRWDESNIPKDIPFVNHMLKKEQWAFASDCLRFWVLYHHGGIYMDTDMRIFQDFDPLIKEDALFFGKENESVVSGGIFGCDKHNQIMHHCLVDYLKYKNSSEIDHLNLNDLVVPKLITSQLKKFQFVSDKNEYQKNEFFTIYPTEVFYPISFDQRIDIDSFKPTELNYGIHLWNASWHDEFQNITHKKFRKSITIFLKKLIKN
ncbi:MAG TPA: hypothetical protein DCQ58_07140, partial [Saprospirales bacterium]|nr:hypothetical protein [Saprospirales bacterium]